MTLDMEFTRPESYVVSVRLNKEESQVLKEAARFRGMKLSTYIKWQALQSARLPQVTISVSTNNAWWQPPGGTWTVTA